MRILVAPASPEAKLLVQALGRIGHDARIDRPADWVPDIIHFLAAPPAIEIGPRTVLIGPDQIPKIAAIDTLFWDPAADQRITRRYNRNTVSMKRSNKTALQQQQGLPVDPNIPLVGLISLNSLAVPEGTALQAVQLPADQPMFYAGCDLIYGEKGLSRLIADRYGAVTVNDRPGLDKMLALYPRTKEWELLQRELMGRDHSWDAAAKQCLTVYVKELNQKLFKAV